MRRLLTGYALSFNLRHNRTGHLFQNRYKSLVCDEDSYLLELVCYLHLNPLRVGIVPDLSGLDRFPWSGHPVMMVKSSLTGQNTEEVLSSFGRRVAEARRRYGAFIEDGVTMGTSEDLGGSGRSSIKEPVGDSRFLGDSAFVERPRAHDALEKQLPAQEPIQEIINRVAEQFSVSPQAILSKSRLARILDARTTVCHAAIEAGHSGAEVGRHLRMTRSGVFTAMKRGESSSGKKRCRLDDISYSYKYKIDKMTTSPMRCIIDIMTTSPMRWCTFANCVVALNGPFVLPDDGGPQNR